MLPSTGVVPGTNYPGAKVPALDAMDMWPLLTGKVKTSPRTGETIEIEQHRAASQRNVQLRC
eukprot:COSAG06_NODE_1074_length_10817_cov_7.629315_4_plen_62_part_00